MVATDLDRTLIWSARAAGEVANATCVEWYESEPLSYVPAGSEELLGSLITEGRLVPVTTRTETQLRRVQLPGGLPRFAVCLNGGRVLVDGEEDLTHRDRVRAELAASASQAEAGTLFAQWAGTAAGEWGPCRLREAEGMFHYAVFDEALAEGDLVEDLRAGAAELGWRTSLQGRKLYVVPAGLTKEAALRHLEDRFEVRVVGSAGDSLLDAGMLAAFAPGWVPLGSELERLGQVPRTATLTATTGLAASAEILDELATLLSGQVSRPRMPPSGLPGAKPSTIVDGAL